MFGSLGDKVVTVLDVCRIRKSYKKDHEVVKEVSFGVSAGEIFAFLGPNGAGKTTTIKMITGLILPDSGSITVNGRCTKVDSAARKDLGSVLEGNRNIYWRMTTFENLVYFNVHKGTPLDKARTAAEELLVKFNLKEKRNVQVRNLSRGMQQKLSIAIAMAHKPKLLLLDEPTLGLDVKSTIEVIALMEQLKDEGIAIVLTTHQLDVAQRLSDRIAIIEKGEIIKECDKDALIEEFSQDAYQIELMGAMSEEKAALLKQKCGAEINEKSIMLVGGSTVLYEALALIQPDEIKKIERLELNLTQIFLHLTGHTIDA